MNYYTLLLLVTILHISLYGFENGRFTNPHIAEIFSQKNQVESKEFIAQMEEKRIKEDKNIFCNHKDYFFTCYGRYLLYYLIHSQNQKN